MPSGRIVLGVGVMVGLFQSPAASQDRPSYYYSSGDRIPITIESDRIAVTFRISDSTMSGMQSAALLTLRLAPLTRDIASVRVFENEAVAVLQLTRPLALDSQVTVMRTLAGQEAVAVVGRVVTTADGTEMVMTDQLVAKFRDSLPRNRLEAILDSIGLRDITPESQRTTWRILRLVEQTERLTSVDVANALVERGWVDFSHPNFIVETIARGLRAPSYASPDPLLGKQWHLENRGGDDAIRGADARARQAWPIESGRPTTVIAILDSGIEWRHPDLVENVKWGYDAASDPPDSDPSPRSSGENHGTSVAGLAAAVVDNGIAGAGVCPRCTLMPIRALGGAISVHAAAIEYAVDHGASVISNSWGYGPGVQVPDVVVQAIRKAVTSGRGNRGTPVLFAAPNDDVDFCAARDIASLSEVISVSGSNSLDESTNFGRGTCLDVVAPTWSRWQPGTLGIVTTKPHGDTTEEFGGTSAATPIVAGAVGLLLSRYPGMTASEVRSRHRGTADKIAANPGEYDAKGFSTRFGFGRVNVERLLRGQ